MTVYRPAFAFLTLHISISSKSRDSYFGLSILSLVTLSELIYHDQRKTSTYLPGIFVSFRLVYLFYVVSMIIITAPTILYTKQTIKTWKKPVTI